MIRTPTKSELRRLATFTIPREMVPTDVREADLEQLPEDDMDDVAVPGGDAQQDEHVVDPPALVPSYGWRAWPTVPHRDR